MTASRVFVALCIALLVLLAILSVATYVLVLNHRNGEYIIECTTAGPDPPPSTGHPCFDDGQKRTAEAVSQIVDVNGNGIPDVIELAESVGHPLPPRTTTTGAP